MSDVARAGDQRAAIRDRAEAVLRGLAGPTARLREDQWRAIEALVCDRRRVLCVQRTGWGKSAVYFIATALLRQSQPGPQPATPGPTVIVSPLLALMRNQIAAAATAGIHARTINSANLDEWDEITSEIRAGTVDVLLISPERLNNPDFRDTVLPRLAASTGLLVVDEAHCVSDWGHDFRPDYRRIRSFLAGLAPETPVLATTATANGRVTTDVAEQLSGRSDARSGPLVLRGPLGRESLRLAVLELPTPAHRLAWLAESLDRMSGSGIIYTLTVAAAGETAEFLRSRGHEVASYTGKAEDAERRAAERDLLDNKVKALVATSALGMGFDKPDLGFVVHLGAPASPIAYYQQIGRAGRAVASAEVVLLPGAEDTAIWRYFAGLAFPAEDQVRAVLRALDTAGRPLSTQAIEPLVDLRRGRLEMMLKVLDVDGAVRRVRGGWVATGEPWTYDTTRYQRIATARHAEQQSMLDYARTPGCRMEYLRRCLDDPRATPCGRCDRCDPRFAASLNPAVPASALTTAQTMLGRPGVTIAPRRMWPTGLGAVGVRLSGKIPPAERTEPGRALGRLSDLGWGDRLRRLLGDETPDGPVPADVVAGVVEVLTAWSKGDDPWWARPVAVLAISSRRRAKLVDDLANQIATVGRLPMLGLVRRVEDTRSVSPAPATVNSAQRVRALHEAFVLPEDLVPQVSALRGPLLLVDDAVDSGWTMAIVGRLLRRNGAPAVLPLALAAT
jgi:ATP-dependent DNA helicase RecQ